jgi:hypothetical protein
MSDIRKWLNEINPQATSETVKRRNWQLIKDILGKMADEQNKFRRELHDLG